jgi:hypothetical protein
MDETTYKNIIKNINQQKEYCIKDGMLYYNQSTKWLRIIRKHEFEAIMYLFHDHELSAHFATQVTYEKIREKYYWKGMLKDIETYVKSCDQCQRRGKPQGKHELHPIKVKYPFYQIGIDIVGPLPRTEKGNKYIVVAMDYFTKWPEAKPIKEATAKEVSTFIFEDIICRHGCPQRILTDRGSHFNNQLVKILTEKFNIKHGFSTPYHPKTNGLVERFNKTLCEALAKLTNKNKEWDDKISPVLFAYRSKKQSSTQIEPFYLTYGRKVTLTNEDNEKETSITEHINHIIEELPKERDQAKLRIENSQKHQKEYHDKKGKRKQEFKIGDKVLYYNAAKEKQWSGKLDEKWKGPYYIHTVLINGSYKIKEINGKVLKTPVNGEWLKIYHSRESFEPMVVII